MAQFPDHKKQFLKAVNFSEVEIAGIEGYMDMMAQKAVDEQLHSREQQQPTVAQPQTQQQPVDSEAQVKQAQEFIVKALEPIMTTLNTRLSALEEGLAQLKQQGESLTPAASALAAKSIIQQQGDHVIKGRGDQGPKENNSDKEAQQQVQSVTGVPFLDNLLALNDAHSNKRFQVGG